MASKFVCTCGTVVRTNLYEGHGLHLLVAEESTDPPERELHELYEHYIEKIVRESLVVAKCSQCGTLALIGGESIKLYAPVAK